MRIHLDTDFGGDPDDACALAFLLGSPEVTILGITTNLDGEGRRAGCVGHYFRLARRSDIPVVSGARATLSKLARHSSTAEDRRYWPEPPVPVPSEPGAALDLLSTNIAAGAAVVAIGALTNLALLEVASPGSLHGISVVFMGGWLRGAVSGLPPWGPEMDWNVQCDQHTVMIVAAAADLTLVTLPATLAAHLRASQLPRLRASGAVGELLALQSEVHARANRMSDLALRHPGLPSDLLNFHYDPVTCAVAEGWAGATVATRRFESALNDGILGFHASDAGRPMRGVTEVDGEAFAAPWLERIERLNAGPVGASRPTSR
jgi:inosine-uridine nucleoside N-ribohydrolase